MEVLQIDQHPNLEKEFLEFPVRLYKGNGFWIRPLDKDIQEVFDPEVNKMFRHGECERWILNDDAGKTIGRIAAFYDRRLWKPNQPKVGGIGFFECINDQAAANLLFETSVKWLRGKGLEGMDGSINFGDRDKNWGILVDGFDKEPNYGMPYTLPYYVELFEQFGFRVYFFQLTYARKIKIENAPAIQAKYKRISEDKSFHFEHWEPAKADVFIKAFADVYNQAWAKHGVPAMSEAHVRGLFAKMKPVMDKRILWFGFYENRPIAFFMMLPELNQFFKHVNGKLDLWGKAKFIWHRYVIGTRKIFGVIFGVVPDFQGKGVEGAMIMECQHLLNRTKYEYIEMNWIGDFNPKMIHVLELLGAHEVKRHATFRLYFDRDYPFERMKSI